MSRFDWYSQQSKRRSYKTPFGTVVSYNPTPLYLLTTTTQIQFELYSLIIILSTLPYASNLLVYFNLSPASVDLSPSSYLYPLTLLLSLFLYRDAE
jgi:hypothetical protein